MTCSIASGFGGFGFTGNTSTSGGAGFGGFGGGSAAAEVADTADLEVSVGSAEALCWTVWRWRVWWTNKSDESTLYGDVNTTISGIAAVEPILQVSEGQNETISFYGRSFTRMVPNYIIEGVPLISDLVDNYAILPTNITAGQNLQAGEVGDVLLSENNSAYFGAGVGDTVNILGQNFKVVGIYSPTSVADTETLYMNLSDAQALTNNTGYITSFRVFTQTTDDVSTVQTIIQNMHPELQ